jgi:probable O-glycosylation ligase (exosortase A-associated)
VRDILVLGFFLPSLPICLFRPYYGVLLWTIVAFVNPQHLAYGYASTFPLAEAVAIPTLAGFLIFSRSWRRLASREFALIALLWVWFTITSYVSANTPLFAPHASDTWYRWGFVSKILLMTAMAICLIDSVKKLRIFMLVIAGSFGLFIAKSLPFMILTGGEFRLYGPPGSMIADNNDFGLALNMTLPLLFFLARIEPNRRLKILLYGLFLATIPAVLFTYSRGALLGLVAVSFLMFLQMRQRLMLIPVIVLTLVLALVFAPQAWRDRMSTLGNDQLDSSELERINAWTFSWNLANDFPITGGGFDTFTPELFKVYAPNTQDVHGPHSVYFGVLAEHGFTGLFLYLALVFSSLFSVFSVARQARRYGDERALAYANMFRLSLVGFLTSGMFLGRAYFDYFFTIVACIIVLKHACKQYWAEGYLIGEPQPLFEETPAGELVLAGEEV